MKKNLLLTFILVLVWGAAMSFPTKNELNRRISANEILELISSYHNPAEVPGLAEMILSFINYQIANTEKYPKGTMTEVLHKEWVENTWVNTGKELIYLDDNGWATESYNYVWVEGAWSNAFCSLITNNGSGWPTHILMKSWGETGWVNFMQIDYTYNQYGYLQIIMQLYYGTMWVNMMKADFFYNTQGLGTQIITQGWDMLNSAWVNDSKDTYTYDNNGWLIEELAQYWEEGDWVNEEIGYLTNDANGHVQEKLKKAWNNNTWEDYLHFTYSYNPQWLLSQEICESWYGGTWENDYRYTYQYDAQNRMIEELYESWEAKGWVNNEIANWTYDLAIGYEQIKQFSHSLSVYPNPARDKIFVCFSLNSGSEVNINLYDFTGKLVKQIRIENKFAVEHTIKLPVLEIPEGMYFISLESNFVILATQRLVIIR